jgi:hypothetical protein
MNVLSRFPHAIVRAASDWGGLLGGKGPGGTGEGADVPTLASLETLFSNIVQFVVSIAGVALFVMLIVGGFSFLFSGGDPKKLEKARGTITNAIMGLILIVAAYIILRIIGVFTGTTGCITKFQIGVLNPCSP